MSLVDEHNTLWKNILDEYDKGDYTFDSPLININPFGSCPLSAVIMFSSGCKYAKSATLTIVGQGGDSDITHVLNDNSSHNYHFIPIAGLYPGVENKVRVKLEYVDGRSEGREYNITTDDLPNDIKRIPIIMPGKYTPSAMANGLTFMAPINTCFFAIDGKGIVRWYLNEGYYIPGDFSDGAFISFIRLNNGNFLIDMWKKYLYEVTIIGRCVKFIDLTNMRYGLHHDMYELDDGKLLLCIEDHDEDVIEDYIGIFDYNNSHSLIKYADFKEIIPTNRAYQPNIDSILGGKKDWLHINRVIYHKDRDFFVISARHQNAIVGVKEKQSCSYGQMDMIPLWILGSHSGWEDKFKPYLLTPIDDGGKEIKDNDLLDKNFWPWGQHSVRFIDINRERNSKDYNEIDIILFNNGNYRSYDKTKQIKSSENWSEAVHYRIHIKDMTVKRIWSFGKELGSLRYCSFVCNVQDLGNSYLLNYGGIHLNEIGINVGLPLGDPPMDRGKMVYPKVYICEVDKRKMEVIFDFELSIGQSDYLGFFNFKALRLPMYPKSIEAI
jgi:arylsulfate sulfotransferase